MINYKQRLIKETKINLHFLTFIILTITLIIISFLPHSSNLLLLSLTTLFKVFIGLILLFEFLQFIYYYFILKIDNNDTVIDSTLIIEKIYLKPYFDRGLYNKYSAKYLGIVIIGQKDSEKLKLLYPFTKADLKFSSLDKVYKYKEVSIKLNTIKNIEVKYLKKSKVIIESSLDLEELTFSNFVL